MLVILTGATGGLGRCLAREIIDSRIGDLICVYRNQKKFDEIFRESRDRIKPYRLSQHDDFSKLCGQIGDAADLSVVLNAFSILPLKRVGEFEPNEIEQTVYGNVTQNFTLLNAVIHFCKANARNLRIINLDSGAADHPLMGWGCYCAAKAFINSFLSVVALENSSYRVVSFDPGVMDTEMQAAIRATNKETFDRVETFIGYKTEGVLHDPSDVAKSIMRRYLSDWRADNLREKYKA